MRFMTWCEDRNLELGDITNTVTVTSDAPVTESLPETAFASSYRPAYPAGT